MRMNVPTMSLMSVGEGLIDQSYIVNDDSFLHLFGSSWWAQTFTPATSHLLRRFILKFDKEGSPGILTASLRATSAGKPTGADLAVGTFDLDRPIILSGGQWFYLDMTTPFSVVASTQYAIVCRTAGVDTNNDGQWKVDITSPTYAGGTIVSSSDSGGTWNAPDSTVDALFKEGT